MKRTALLAVTALVPGLFLMQGTGSSSVAVLDFDRAVAESAGKDAIQKLNTFAAEQRDGIQKKAKEAEDIQNRLRLQDRALSAAARDQLTKSLENAQIAVKKLSNEAEQKVDQMRQQLLGPAEKKTMDAINTYATEHSVKIVLDSSTLRNGLVYVHDTADITTEIIRRIAANLEKPNKQDARNANFVRQAAHRQWITIPSFAHDFRHLEEYQSVTDIEHHSR